MSLSGEALIAFLDSQYPCRTLQLRQLSALLHPDLPSPPSIILYGLEATGKSLLTKSLLDASQLSHSWVSCHECITARHLTERIATAVKETVQESNALEKEVLLMRADNVNALAVVLGKVLGGWGGGKHVLVLDRIDRQRELTPILLAGLARLGEIIKSLTILFICSAPSPRFLSTSSIPHIHFPPYTKDELISILSKNPQRLNIPPSRPATPSVDPEAGANEPKIDEEHDLAESLFVYTRFLSTVYESLAKPTAKTLPQLKSISDKMWDEFVEPIRRGEYGTRNFSQLYVLKKDLFRVEQWILDEVVPKSTTTTAIPNTASTTTVPTTTTTTTTTAQSTNTLTNPPAPRHDLPYFSKYLLLSAYLASYNPSRLDHQFFTKSPSDKRRRRNHTQHTTTSTVITKSTGGSTRSSRQFRKISRRLLGPQPFPLERLLAIFHAITPPSGAALASADIMTQIATLASLRLLVRAGAGGDPLEGGGGKWRVNVGWEYVRGLARSVRFDVEELLVEV